MVTKKLFVNKPFFQVKIEELVSEIHNSEGQTVNPGNCLDVTYITTFVMMMSYRFQANDKNFTMFNERVIRGMQLFGLVLIGEHERGHWRTIVRPPVDHYLYFNLRPP
ncbi:hypothetical protein PYW08_012610 [Mythimna loreyi]|uniref:Uncharacterized protein n=2 Tax=Mythimna loreyi TaxID=667449 RepID=A0ACC2Q2J1_9NEOP|nr:hypothetical protein PYW08_012596 [Mythimna loreyi]KAJ8705564.1 hypothetical protein PYW08_012610 [Mythimna loreyi]